MIIIGIDPSLVNTGLIRLKGTPGNWVMSNLSLVVTTSANPAGVKKKIIRRNYDDLDRARALATAIMAFTVDADYICVEIPQIGGANMQARSMWTSGVALGVLSQLPASKLVELTPKEVKDITGNPKASKEEMCDWAYQTFPLAAWPTRKLKGAQVRLGTNHHRADAAAAAVAGLVKLKLWP